MLKHNLWVIKVTEENLIPLTLYRQSCKLWKKSWEPLEVNDYIAKNGTYFLEHQLTLYLKLNKTTVVIDFTQFKKYVLHEKT